MTKLHKPWRALLLCALTASVAGCDLVESPDAGYSELQAKPVLADAFAKTETPSRLASLSVISVELSCDSYAQTVTGLFTFDALDGRAPITVAGATQCQNPGKLLYWDVNNTFYARENYTAALVAQEVEALVAVAKLAPVAGTRKNDELAVELERKYASPINDLNLRAVTFTCLAPGIGYQYTADYYRPRPKTVSGVLKTSCPAAHHNFEVKLVIPAPGAGRPKHLLDVAQYNGVSAAVMTGAFSEFIEGGPRTSTF